MTRRQALGQARPRCPQGYRQQVDRQRSGHEFDISSQLLPHDAGNSKPISPRRLWRESQTIVILITSRPFRLLTDPARSLVCVLLCCCCISKSLELHLQSLEEVPTRPWCVPSGSPGMRNSCPGPERNKTCNLQSAKLRSCAEGFTVHADYDLSAQHIRLLASHHNAPSGAQPGLGEFGQNFFRVPAGLRTREPHFLLRSQSW